MLRRMLSLLIVLSLSVSMLTGCTFLGPFVQMGMEKLISDKKNEEKQGIDKSDSLDKNVESNKDSKGLESEKSDNVEYNSDSLEELLEIIYETEYQASVFKQEDIESETVGWICATYALYNKANDKEMDRISGFWDPVLMDQSIQDALQEKMKNHIWRAWGIDSRKSFAETLYRLLNKDRLEEEAQELLGWDLSRANQMIGDAYYIKFINLEECLDLSLLISQRIQNNYNSWDELSESHLEGLQRLKKDDPEDPESESGKRLEAYNELKAEANRGEGPYALPFDMELEASWDADTVADKVAEREAEEKERERAEEEFQESKTKEDADGRITVCGYGEDDPEIKMRIPEGFAETDYSTETFVTIEDVNEEISISYSIRTLYGEDEPKDSMEYEKTFELEFKDTIRLIDEKYEEKDDEVTFYFAVEDKDFYEEGNSMIEYIGYKAKKINGQWMGLYVMLDTETKANVTSEDAVAWMFSDVQLP